MRRWLIDGMNVIGSRPTGWWRDREGAMRGLVDDLEAYGNATDDELTVVFDGRPRALPTREKVVVRFAPANGRDAADDEIDELAARDDSPSTLTVVTSDAELAGRVRSHGVEVESAKPFRRRLDRTRRRD
jgi:predicted RNA-binding protein with PIN domain